MSANISAASVKQLRDLTGANSQEAEEALVNASGDIEKAKTIISSKVTTSSEDKKMANISAALVKELRDETGAGMMDAKKALVETEGDKEKAKELLRQKGMASADKKAGRIAAEGSIGSYVHFNGKIGVLVEVNCETDFVAKTDEFKELVHDICLQIASSSPEFISREDISPEYIEEEKRIEMGKEDLEGKPDNIKEKIVVGRVDKMLQAKCLLEQQYVKNTDITIDTLIREKIAKIGEKISIRRFVRYELGEGLEKRKDNLAEEVQAQIAGKK